jgi:hypothetical protein
MQARVCIVPNPWQFTSIVLYTVHFICLVMLSCDLKMHNCGCEKSILYRRNVLCTARRNRKVNCMLRGERKDEPNLWWDRGFYLYAAKRKKRHGTCCSKEKQMSAYCSVRVEVWTVCFKMRGKDNFYVARWKMRNKPHFAKRQRRDKMYILQ